MIWKRIPADPATKLICRIRVLADGTEVEYPVMVSVVVVQELLRVFSSIAVEAFNPYRRVTHDYEVVGNVHQVYGREKVSL